MKQIRILLAVGAIMAALLLVSVASAAPGADVRLTNDFSGGYVSTYTLATGIPYTDATLAECSIARARQNEPAVAVDPRNTNVLIGSSNDYCGVYAGSPPGTFIPAGPIWLGYYRSENMGASFVSSLVPGYPDDKSPYAAQAHIRTASAGDPVIAWDNHGRVFMGSESSGDPASTKKTFGDVWVAVFDNPGGPNGNPQDDGKRFVRSEVVAHGSSAPNLLGVFNDKTSIEVDRTGGTCDGNAYFAWSRFTGNAQNNAIYFSRSTNHGAGWSTPMKVSTAIHGVQDPDIAVTGNGHVYVTFRQFASTSGQPDAVVYVKSTDCGRTFAPPLTVTTFTPYDAQDVSAPQPIPQPASARDDPLFSESAPKKASLARDCGDFSDHCQSGYTFFRHTTAPRSTADQLDKANEYIYIVYDPTKTGTIVSTGTTYGSVTVGKGSQEAIYFTRLNGKTGAKTTRVLLDNQSVGHQVFPDISADGGMLHVLWWDSRNDPCYSPTRPIGNCADRTTTASLDVFGTTSTDQGATWAGSTRISDVSTNPNYEQFGNRQVPFGGDYLWITSMGSFAFGTWTDWRDTVQGTDPREGTGDEDGATADVKQCRTFNAAGGFWSGDQCPHDGGIDQNIYGDYAP